MEKILITGAGGFLGRRAARQLQQHYAVTAVTHAELDITDPDAVKQMLQAVRPAVVFHCAAISGVDVCEKNPELAQRINVTGALHVIRACRDIGAKCIVCSSDQVYMGSNPPQPHRECEVLTPANVYGRGKLEMEQRGLEIDPDSVYLRLTWMFDNKTLAPDEHGDFLRTVLSKLKTGEPIPCAISDHRGLTDVNEVIGNLPKAFRLPGGVYNYGSPNTKSVYTLLQDVLAGLSCPAALQPLEYPYRNLMIATEQIESHGICFRSSEQALRESLREALSHWETVPEVAEY